MLSRSLTYALFFAVVLALGGASARVSAQDEAGAGAETEAEAEPAAVAEPVETEARRPVEAEAPPAVTVEAPAPRQVRPHTIEAEAVVDSFWGFQVRGRGAIALHEMVDLTVHAAMYVNPSLGRGGGFDDLWVETGLGARAVLLDAALLVGGEVGITHGSLLSDGSRGVPFDGLALRAIADLRLPLVEDVVGLDGYAHFAFYTPIRQESGETRTLLHTMLRAGAYLFDIVGLGLYFEQLHVRIQDDTVASNTTNPVTWIGGYVETRFDFGLVIGTAMGLDLTIDDDLNDSDFYRVWIGWRG